MFSIDPTMCFNVERVTSKAWIVCCEQTPSGPWRILVKLVIFLTSEMQCLKKPFTCPITLMASLAENVFTLARGSFLLWTPKTLRNLLRFSKYFNNPLGPTYSAHDEPMTCQENQKRFVLHLYIFHFSISNQQKYREGHVFSNPRTFLIKHLICYNFLRISRIPETTSQYPVSQ